jgi:hypothetical protein
MPSLQSLRLAHRLARLVLVWFVLSLGVAVASPIVHPQAMELICSGSGAIKLLVKTDDGVKEAAGHTLDCPLCAVSGTPPPIAHSLALPVPPLSHVLRPIPAAHIAWLTAAPLPARGPPPAS